MILNKFLHRYLAPEPGDTGGDRGDSYVPPTDDAEVAAAAAQAAADAAAAALEAELAATAATAAAVAEAAKADPDADKTKAKDTRIPLSRHTDILNREREARAALEAQLAQYQKGAQVANINADITAAENVVLGLEKEYAKLITDGEVDKATAVMAQIRRTEREMGEAKSDMKIQAAEARATENARYNIAVERIEASYPQLNPDHVDFDAATTKEVADLAGAYRIQGLTPTAAMQKAVKLLVGAETTRQEAAVKTAPRVDADDVAAARKAAAVGKALDATGKTPPSLGKVGLDSDKAGGGITNKDIMKMSQADFAKLPDDALAAMRGDVL